MHFLHDSKADLEGLQLLGVGVDEGREADEPQAVAVAQQTPAQQNTEGNRGLPKTVSARHIIMPFQDMNLAALYHSQSKNLH